MTTTSPLYEATRTLPLKQVTALVRTEVRKTVKAFNESSGTAPIGVSVTMDGYRSISVDLQLPEPLYDFNAEFINDIYIERPLPRWTAGDADFMRTYKDGKYSRLIKFYELLSVVESIRQQYNYNNSDPMTDYFDVRYYGTTKFTRGKRGW
ncbi:MAG: hypothetical protein EBT75_00230 [Proteobacteria bacterium]|nr:hypothetical protein [Pseudomonadota bacterium]NBS49049.1 hypothetical protein [Verrucomicrobiota bacterium]